MDAGVDSCVFEGVVRARVFTPRCADSQCHDRQRPKAGLDLERPGIANRIAGQRSVQSECRERLVIVPGVARASFLMDKVLGMHGECGDSMPPDDPLTLDEQRCLVEWIDAMDPPASP